MGTPNVIRRGGILYFRRAVPKHLRSRIDRRELVVSLATGDVRVGRLRSRYIYVATEALFSRLEPGMLSRETIDKIVTDFHSMVRQIGDLDRLTSPEMTPTEQERLQVQLAEHLSATKLELGRGDFTMATLGASIVVQRLGLQLDPLERRQVEQAILRTGVELTADARARLAGQFDYLTTDPLVRAAFGQDDPSWSSKPVATPVAPIPTLRAGDVTKNAELFEELGVRFLNGQAKGRLWDPQTIAQARKSFALFREVNGNAQLHTYGRSHAQRFKEVLQDLPWDYGKAAQYRGKSLVEIGDIGRDRVLKAERLSSRTVRRHFAALSGLWRWAINEQLATENPFVGFSFPSLRRANEQRDMWTAQELKALFATPVWTGALSAGRRSTPGDVVIRDEKYWLPLIAIFSGPRQEEAAQLFLEDVRKVEGFVVFDINARPPRMLKNRNAVRKVPVHSMLIRLWLLDYIGDLKGQGATVLFPNLTPGGADGPRGHAFSKWFTRYRKDVGLYRGGLDFHSLRHSATTFMQRAGVPIAAIDELTGHATPGETARYSHGLSMKQLAEAIETIAVDLP